MTAADSTNPQFTDDIVPGPRELVSAIMLAALDRFDELEDDFPTLMVGARLVALEGLPKFSKFADRAFLPVSGLVALERRARAEEGASPEEMRLFDEHLPEDVSTFAVGAWMAEKLCVGFSKAVYRAVLAGDNGWQDLTGDWLLVNCEPFGMFLRFPDADPGGDWVPAERELQGCLAGLTFRGNGLVLYLQCVYEDGYLPPEMYMELPLRHWETLGDTVRRYRWDHVAFDELARRFCSEDCPEAARAKDAAAFRRRQTKVMREVARIALPLLVAALGDDYARNCVFWDPEDGEVTDLGSKIPCREPESTCEELLECMNDTWFALVKVSQEPLVAEDAAAEPWEAATPMMAAVIDLCQDAGAVGSLVLEVPLELRELEKEKSVWFGKYADRVFMPPSAFVAEQRRGLAENGGSPEELARRDEEMPDQLAQLVVVNWAVEKLCVSFSKSVLAAVRGNDSWWRDVTADWLLERYKAWSMYLRLPCGDEEERGGYVTGITADGEGLALYCQHVRPDGGMPPDVYFEIPLTCGKTLGEIQSELVYDHVALEALAKRDDRVHGDVGEFRRRQTFMLRALAEMILPLLVAALGDDYERRCFRWTPSVEERIDLGSEIPFHDPQADREALREALYDEYLRIVEITMPAKKHLN